MNFGGTISTVTHLVKNNQRDDFLTFINGRKTLFLKRILNLMAATLLLGFMSFILYGWIGSIFGKEFGYIFATFTTFSNLFLFFRHGGLDIGKEIESDGKKSWLRRIKVIIRCSTATVIYGTIVSAILLSTWTYLDQKLANRLQALEKTTQAIIVANNLKHKGELHTLNVKHQKDIARERSKNRRKVAKIRMKERSKRWFASIPIIGTALVLWSGKDEYDDYATWKAENPTGTAKNYAKYKKELLIGD